MMDSGVKGKQYQRLVIRNPTVINGRGTPAEGPMDLVIEDGVITEMWKVDAVSLHRYPDDWKRPQGDRVIDATGMCVVPGLVEMHAHVPMDNANCGPRGTEYAYKLWLAHGVTTLRTVGWGVEEKLYEHRRMSEDDGELPIPRLFIMHGCLNAKDLTPDEARERVGEFKSLGADGVKLIGGYYDVVEAICDESRRLGMDGGVSVHLALNSEVDAVMAAEAGVSTIEHTYGIPEAAMPGVQSFPLDYNEMDELVRFRESAFNWIEAEQYPERIIDVLDLLIDHGTVWNPTMVAYESCRDLGRIRTLEWNEQYAVPPLRETWKPTPGQHASFHFDWKTSDEIAWKEKYRIWMKYLRVFFERGGVITVGSDAGSMYVLYGFSLIREMELLQEAGIHPIDIMKMATTNASRILGLTHLTEGVRKGYAADLAIVDGNPLDNFKVMYGLGVEKFLDDRVTRVRTGGVKWTIRDGVLFDATALLQDVEDYVAEFDEYGPPTW
ncbi:MAG: amidohydrolase family protein [Bacillota bacterium]